VNQSEESAPAAVSDNGMYCAGNGPVHQEERIRIRVYTHVNDHRGNPRRAFERLKNKDNNMLGKFSALYF
jgi:hypothetical protein